MLNEDQKIAYDKIINWIKSYKKTKKNIFVLTGNAGTGKTFLLNKINEFLISNNISANILSYTGKACEVLREKGINKATTIHSTIYDLITDEYGNIKDWILTDENIGDIIIVDEYSFLEDNLITDLISLGRPILFCGDNEQIKIKQNKIKLHKDTDVFLKNIVRQAQNNPIIRNSMKIRQGKFPRCGFDKNKHGLFGVIKKNDNRIREIMLKFDQILVGTIKLQTKINKLYRRYKNFTGFIPNIGERLICLKNKKDINNGQQFIVEKVWKNIIVLDNQRCIKIKFKDYKKKFIVSLETFVNPDFDINKRLFKSSGNDYTKFRQINFFQFAYAITTMKAQGSEWNNVLLFAYDGKWLGDKFKNYYYTGVTRAKKDVFLLYKKIKKMLDKNIFI